MTDSEIIKALECCGVEEANCRKCIFNLQNNCRILLAKEALDLINRLQAENENLKDILYDADGVNLVNYWHQQCKIAENGCKNFGEENKKLQAENKILQNFKSYFDFYYGSDIEILGIDENGDTTSFDELYNCAIANAESIEHHISHIIKTAKAEAVKEFEEKLENRILSMLTTATLEEKEIICACIGIKNNVLKELAGEGDG